MPKRERVPRIHTREQRQQQKEMSFVGETKIWYTFGVSTTTAVLIVVRASVLRESRENFPPSTAVAAQNYARTIFRCVAN